MAEIQTYPMILGIDAGGTHTRFVLMDEKGKIMDETVTESMHFIQVGFEGIKTNLLKYVEMMKQKNFDPSSFKVAMGLAGYGEDASVRKNIENSVYSVFPDALLYSDVQFAHIAALNNKDGIFVISGTGSIAFKREDEKFSRTGGFGYLLDDAGSAFWIGKRTLEIFTRQIDGRLEKSPLYKTLMTELELENPYHIIADAASHKETIRNYVAEIALIGSKIEDKHLYKIYEDAGKELADLANAFGAKTKTSVSIGGSVLLKNETVKASFLKNLNPVLNFIEPENRVEYAALILYRN